MIFNFDPASVDPDELPADVTLKDGDFYFSVGSTDYVESTIWVVLSPDRSLFANPGKVNGANSDPGGC
ncbi:MAG: hypothetical protein ACRBK7_18450 [Acidimicrobiales bacterium]